MLLAESLARVDMTGQIMSFAEHEKLSRLIRGQFRTASTVLDTMSRMHKLAATVMAPTPLGMLAQQAVNVQSAWATFLSHYSKDIVRIPLNFGGFAIEGQPVTVTERPVYQTPFGHITHLERTKADGQPIDRRDPPLIVVVPHSGHRVSLLQETIGTMLRDHDVYYVEMNDANDIPMRAGLFDYHDYIDFIRSAVEEAGKDSESRGGPARAHIMAVCQPGPPAFIAAMMMAREKNPYRPQSIASLASPFDTRINPTQINIFARSRPMEWFEQNVIYPVPHGHGYEGEGRDVYPGYLQRAGFVVKSIDSHIEHTVRFHDNLVSGNEDAAQAKMKFDDVFLFDIASLTAEFYLQTVQYNFRDDLLPRGQFIHRNVNVTGEENTDIALITIEGDKDDITGTGQTQAVHGLCPNLPESMKHHLTLLGAGHYSVFSRKPFQNTGAPWLKNAIRNADPGTYNDPVFKPS